MERPGNHFIQGHTLTIIRSSEKSDTTSQIHILYGTLLRFHMNRTICIDWAYPQKI